MSILVNIVLYYIEQKLFINNMYLSVLSLTTEETAVTFARFHGLRQFKCTK